LRNHSPSSKVTARRSTARHIHVDVALVLKRAFQTAWKIDHFELPVLPEGSDAHIEAPLYFELGFLTGQLLLVATLATPPSALKLIDAISTIRVIYAKLPPPRLRFPAAAIGMNDLDHR
jgi:hypothetical protein